MSYLDKLIYLRKKVPNYTNESTKWLFNKIRNTDNKFIKTNLSDLKIGSFYFMVYDKSGINKSSKMEQFVPFMIVDYNPNIDKRVLWILNLNFIPLNIKEAFFVNFLNNYDNILEANSKQKTINSELSLKNINYDNMFDETLQYGIDYSIREIRLELVNELYHISTDNLHLLTTLNTQLITGVDEKKLSEIWITKLRNENLEARLDDKKIKSDYESIVKQLQETFKFLDKKLKEL